MRVTHVRRHPVKSFQGEELQESVVDADGLRGDRAWGVRDLETGKILTGRREPRLLLAQAVLGDDGEPTVTLPDGTTCRGVGPDTDAALSGWLGRAVELVTATDTPAATAEFFADATDDSSTPITWTMPPGRFVDAAAVLLVTTASLRAGAALHPDGVWDVRRFRPNLVVDVDSDDWVEDAWVGTTVCVGDVELGIQARCERCTMVVRPQPGGLERDTDVYKSLARRHGGTFGVWASVRVPGVVRVGDVVVAPD